ncbi:MAG TPA: geranylgeranyl reductase family protein [Actinomycetota bacterium]|jgi:geranylgeranyl reductase family protein
MSRTDVLVVGAGPAGSATAYHLARRGVDVVVCDRASFPREKVCGDGLTPRGVSALQRMGVDPTEPGFVRIDGLRVRGGGVRLELPWPRVRSQPSFGVVRTRHDLDHLLVQRAQKAGARVWEETEAAEPLIGPDGWVGGASLLRGARDQERTPEQIRARFVVAADGAASRFAGRAGVRRDHAAPLGIAARRYYRTNRYQDGMFESWLELRDGDRLLPGYGWVFPVGDGILNVGAGLLNSYPGFRDITARGVFDVFLRQLPPSWGIDEDSAVGPLLSGGLPMAMNRRPLAVPGLLLAGDAGGMINPFNGEGIAYAIESGELAAELIHGALASGRPALAQLYPEELRRRYGRYYNAGRIFVRLLGHPWVMQAVTRFGLPRRKLMALLLKGMANLSDGPGGGAQDRILHAILRMVPER